jgi:hypothetical protein
MTEEEWVGCDDPKAMLELLRVKGDYRKLRLFNCAFCRRIWHLLADVRSQSAIEVVEQYDQGRSTDRDVAAARVNAEDAKHAARLSPPATRGLAFATAEAAHWSALTPSIAGEKEPQLEASRYAFARAALAIGLLADDGRGGVAYHRAKSSELAAHANLIRDIFGNPFVPISLDPSWVTPIVASLAQAAYEQRILPSGHLDPARLAILADALEEAGCTEAAILEHLRSAGPHVRECWPIGLLTGRGLTGADFSQGRTGQGD